MVGLCVKVNLRCFSFPLEGFCYYSLIETDHSSRVIKFSLNCLIATKENIYKSPKYSLTVVKLAFAKYW